MGSFEWIMTGFTLLVSLGGAACTVILPILVLGGIGIFLYRRNQQSNTYRQSAQTWPATTGTILMSSVQSKRTGRSRSTYPVVVYQYTVHGQSYQSQRIKAGDQFMSIRVAGQAQATAARYPVGANVTVYYIQPIQSCRVCSGTMSCAIIRATMSNRIQFANRNNNNDNDDRQIVGRSLAG